MEAQVIGTEAEIVRSFYRVEVQTDTLPLTINLHEYGLEIDPRYVSAAFKVMIVPAFSFRAAERAVGGKVLSISGPYLSRSDALYPMAAAA